MLIFGIFLNLKNETVRDERGEGVGRERRARVSGKGARAERGVAGVGVGAVSVNGLFMCK